MSTTNDLGIAPISQEVYPTARYAKGQAIKMFEEHGARMSPVSRNIFATVARSNVDAILEYEHGTADVEDLGMDLTQYAEVTLDQLRTLAVSLTD